MTAAAKIDKTDLGFWFPLIDGAGLPVPRTAIARVEGGMYALLDGETPEGWDTLMGVLMAAGDDFGWPCFLRTGHGSDKHSWRQTCHLPNAAALPRHVANLVEWSALADMATFLPTQTWAIRELLDTAPLFRCEEYEGFPVTREFRFFVRDDVIEHRQPYWPPDACEQGGPDDPEWRAKLAAASTLSDDEANDLASLAGHASAAVGGGFWSIDFLEDRHGKWWLTDMAEGDRSFRWDPRL